MFFENIYDFIKAFTDGQDGQHRNVRMFSGPDGFKIVALCLSDGSLVKLAEAKPKFNDESLGHAYHLYSEILKDIMAGDAPGDELDPVNFGGVDDFLSSKFEDFDDFDGCEDCPLLQQTLMDELEKKQPETSKPAPKNDCKTAAKPSVAKVDGKDVKKAGKVKPEVTAKVVVKLSNGWEFDLGDLDESSPDNVEEFWSAINKSHGKAK